MREGNEAEEVSRLAKLVSQRNAVAAGISKIIGRPALIGHIGEFVASRVFRIQLEESAVHKGSDGQFQEGPLRGKTVNVKWYGKQEGLLDIRPDAVPDFYLVMTGPKTTAASSRGSARLWTITTVYLFDGPELVETLRNRGVKISVATSVRQEIWREAELYPQPVNRRLPLHQDQLEMLALFGPSFGS